MGRKKAVSAAEEAGGCGQELPWRLTLPGGVKLASALTALWVSSAGILDGGGSSQDTGGMLPLIWERPRGCSYTEA